MKKEVREVGRRDRKQGSKEFILIFESVGLNQIIQWQPARMFTGMLLLKVWKCKANINLFVIFK